MNAKAESCDSRGSFRRGTSVHLLGVRACFDFGDGDIPTNSSSRCFRRHRDAFPEFALLLCEAVDASTRNAPGPSAASSRLMTRLHKAFERVWSNTLGMMPTRTRK